MTDRGSFCGKPRLTKREQEAVRVCLMARNYTDDPRVVNWLMRVLRLLPALESALRKTA